jgi:hypothetical protein
MSRADREGRGPFDSPSRLIDSGDRVAGGLRALNAQTRPDGQDEAAAWRRLTSPSRGAGALRWFWSGAFVAAAVAVVVLVGRGPDAPLSARDVRIVVPPFVGQRAGESGEPPVARPVDQQGQSRAAEPRAAAPQTVDPQVAGPQVAEAHAEPPAPRLTLSPRPTSLAPGQAALADEATVDLAEGSTASASADDAWVRVLLDEGEVGLHVAKRVPGGPGFEVVAGGYHFRVLGTRFRVARNTHDGPPVELWVEEGRVAVSHDGRTLGVVTAGGHWDTSEETRPGPLATAAATPRPRPARHASAPPREVAETEAEPPSVEEKPPSPPVSCAVLAEDAATVREAVVCYLGIARGGDLAAQTALFEVARLRRDVLGDDAGALAALQESRGRFPRGMLRDDVDLSIVKLLADLNRHNEAIEEVGRLLADGRRHDVERTADLRVLRGNIYRQVLEDYGHAERDYAAAEEARAPAVSDATFFRGVCLQALGRTEEARATFEHYLGAGDVRFADEAGKRLQRLGR